jgi:hypothetical protein
MVLIDGTVQTLAFTLLQSPNTIAAVFCRQFKVTSADCDRVTEHILQLQLRQKEKGRLRP